MKKKKKKEKEKTSALTTILKFAFLTLGVKSGNKEIAILKWQMKIFFFSQKKRSRGAFDVPTAAKRSFFY